MLQWFWQIDKTKIENIITNLSKFDMHAEEAYQIPTYDFWKFWWYLLDRGLTPCADDTKACFDTIDIRVPSSMNWLFVAPGQIIPQVYRTTYWYILCSIRRNLRANEGFNIREISHTPDDKGTWKYHNTVDIILHHDIFSARTCKAMWNIQRNVGPTHRRDEKPWHNNNACTRWTTVDIWIHDWVAIPSCCDSRVFHVQKGICICVAQLLLTVSLPTYSRFLVSFCVMSRAIYLPGCLNIAMTSTGDAVVDATKISTGPPPWMRVSTRFDARCKCMTGMPSPMGWK